MVTIEVDAGGPVFDQRLQQAIDRGLRDAEQDVANEGHDLWYTLLNQSIRVNHGNYISHLHTARSSLGVVVDDQGVVYGPWLEGVGSRNFPKTRFKGYFSLRRAVQSLRGRATGIAQRAITRSLEALR